MKFGTTKILWINSNILIAFEYYQLFLTTQRELLVTWSLMYNISKAFKSKSEMNIRFLQSILHSLK